MIDRRLNYGRRQIKGFLSSLKPFRSVLDVGAGWGNDLLLAREAHPPADLHAIEIDEESGRKLRGEGIHTHAIDLERDPFPFDAESLDVVMANQILEHTKEIFWALHEISRILAVGGKLIVGVPNLASLHNRLLLALGRQPTPIQNNSAHLRGFTKGDLLRFLDSGFPGGYALRDFAGSNFYPFPPLLAEPLARCFPTLAWGIFLLLEKKKPYGRGFLEFPVQQNLQTNFYLGGSYKDRRGHPASAVPSTKNSP